MSTLDARRTPTSDREPRSFARSSDRAAATGLIIRVRWNWSRRAASRSLGVECPGDVELTLSVAIENGPRSRAGEAALDAVAEWDLRCEGQAVDAVELPPLHRRLFGESIETAGFRHFDLRDDEGTFFRASLSKVQDGAWGIWSRLPEELRIAGGCLSAPAIEVEEGDDVPSTSGLDAHPSDRPLTP